MKQVDSIYRLRHRHKPGAASEVDAKALIAEQSLRSASLGALAAVLILTAVWVYAVMLFDQFFPWIAAVQGFFVGRAVQHFGRGIDWRFPALAAVAAIVGAFFGSFVSALFLTSREFGMSPLPLLGEISWHTVRTFATREFGVIGIIYAATSASIAGFFASRRLTRAEAIALRRSKMQGD